MKPDEEGQTTVTSLELLSNLLRDAADRADEIRGCKDPGPDRSYLDALLAETVEAMLGAGLRSNLARAFKKTICAEMGWANSAIFSYQVRPIAEDVAKILGYDVGAFLREIGFRVDDNGGGCW